MGVQTHWEKVYGEKAPNAVSWYAPHLARSLEIIERAAPSHSASIIDVGGGESTLVDDLLAYGYQNITVLDVSQIAIDVTRKRLATASERIRWIVGNVTKAEFAPRAYVVWHDRAVFHFLTAGDERLAYVRQVANAVKPGGHVLVSTFGTERPTKCGGLDVVRYNAQSLHREFGVRFRLLESCEAASHAVWDRPAVSLLPVQGRTIRSVRSRETRISQRLSTMYSPRLMKTSGTIQWPNRSTARKMTGRSPSHLPTKHQIGNSTT